MFRLGGFRESDVERGAGVWLSFGPDTAAEALGHPADVSKTNPASFELRVIVQALGEAE